MSPNKTLLTAKEGFTLIELLMVIGVIGILAAIVIVAVNPMQILAELRDAERVSNLKQLQKSVESYYVKHQDLPGDIGVWYTNYGANWSIRTPSPTVDQSDPRLIKFFSNLNEFMSVIPKAIVQRQAVYIDTSNNCQTANAGTVMQYIKIDASRYKLSTRLETACENVQGDGGTSTCCPIVSPTSKGRSYEVYELYNGPNSAASSPTY